MKFMTPIRKKFPVTSWRISSHRREHWRSGRMRVAFMKIVESVESLKRKKGVVASSGWETLNLVGTTWKSSPPDSERVEISKGGTFGGLDGVAHEHGDGHWTDATGVGGDFAGDGEQSVEVHVADQTRAGFGGGIGYAVDADVYHGCAWLDHVSFYRFSHAHGGDENIGAKAVGFDVAGG